MAACCEPQGYDLIFSDREAQRAAARYRKSGLSWAPRRTVELFRAGAFAGRTLLEIGGGVGDLQIELMRAGELARPPTSSCCIRSCAATPTWSAC